MTFYQCRAVWFQSPILVKDSETPICIFFLPAKDSDTPMCTPVPKVLTSSLKNNLVLPNDLRVLTSFWDLNLLPSSTKTPRELRVRIKVTRQIQTRIHSSWFPFHVSRVVIHAHTCGTITLAEIGSFHFMLGRLIVMQPHLCFVAGALCTCVRAQIFVTDQ